MIASLLEWRLSETIRWILESSHWMAPAQVWHGLQNQSVMEQETFLFVYGTLRSQMNDPLHRLLEKQAVGVATGTFQGKLYDLGSYPGAVPSHGKDDRVLGEIYRLSEPGRAFKILDAYEGRRFKRKRQAILQQDGKSINAWIYLYAGPVKHRPLISSGDYVQYRNAF